MHLAGSPGSYFVVVVVVYLSFYGRYFCNRPSPSEKTSSGANDVMSLFVLMLSFERRGSLLWTEAKTWFI